MKGGEREALRRLAAEAILKNLKALAAQIPGVRARRGSEPVHDLRVASRRVRTALRLLDDAAPSKRYRRWSRELKRLASALSRARDTDVQADFLREFLKAHRDRAAQAGHRAAAAPASRAPREAADQGPQGTRPLRRARHASRNPARVPAAREGPSPRRSRQFRTPHSALPTPRAAFRSPHSRRPADPQAARQDARVRAVHRAARAAQGTPPHAHRGETLPVHDGGVRAALRRAARSLDPRGEAPPDRARRDSRLRRVDPRGAAEVPRTTSATRTALAEIKPGIAALLRDRRRQAEGRLSGVPAALEGTAPQEDSGAADP